MLYKVTNCAGHVLANTRPHQLHWGDWEMGTVISCIECSQVRWLALFKVGRDSSKPPSFHATVFHAAVFHLKILRSNHNH